MTAAKLETALRHDKDQQSAWRLYSVVELAPSGYLAELWLTYLEDQHLDTVTLELLFVLEDRSLGIA